MAVRENQKYYKNVPFERNHTRIANEMSLVEVLSVDYERRVLTIRDIKDGLIYGDVKVFPANTASFESVDINMPEPGAMGVACNWAYEGTFRFPIIIAWVQSEAYIGVDAIAGRPVTGDQIQGYTDRTRLSYRKAYPGSKTSSYTGGFSERIDTAWDRQSADMSRDKLDSDKRQWTQIAGRKVTYSDAGVSYQGSINRPASPNTVLSPS